MKRLIHEQLEDMMFAQAPEDTPAVRQAYYDDLDAVFKKQTEQAILSVAKENGNPGLISSIENRLKKKEGWRAFAKGTCNNYMLAYSYMMSVIHKNSNKAFKISADLAEALYLTDMEIDTTNIRPPFNAFVIYVDGDVLKHIGEYSAPFKPDTVEVQEYCVSYIMVEFLDSIFRPDGKIMRMVFGYYDPGTNPDDIMNWNNSSFLELELEGSGKFRPKSDDSGLDHFFPEQSLFNSEQKEKAKKYNEAIINFVFSFMFYLNHKPDDVELERAASAQILTQNPKKYKRALKESQKLSAYNIYHIGRKYDGIYKSSKAQFGHELTHRILVRGHVRDQWYGRKVLLPDGTRTLGEYQSPIWIEPFFKGEELEASQKTTVFKVE